ncbi:MAG: OmpH family outer membrane protein [Firmicutes bacterium]|nr:OmpH family outer membrane protein [Bacillota bacterium]
MSKFRTRLLSLSVVIIAAVAVVLSFVGDKGLKAADGAGPIGYVYSPKIIAAVESSPEYTKAQKDYEEFAQKLQKEYESEAEGLDDQTKQKKLFDLEMKLAEKQVGLNKPFQDKIQGAIEEIAKNEGCSIVLSQRVEFEALVPVRDNSANVMAQPMPISIPIVVTGGKDLTDPVLKKLGVK